ncbi:helix-turn-helix domain-containing protein [Protaetiibacter intestinalis]|nr:helix-turn-helix transcriptional regulator [Protaetiibacter intestinalis]
MTAATILRAARLDQGLAQTELARRAGTAQADVSLIERGHRVPTVDTLDRILRSAGHRLIAVPVRGATGVDTAATIADELAEGRADKAFRTFLSYSDSLADSDPAGRVILSAAAPATTGDDAWDAALAAVTEYWLDAAHAPKAEWLRDGSRTLAAPRPLDYARHAVSPDPADVPPQFLSRNILVDETTLASV